ncbi:MAG: DMT family transporter [Alphaproteobacteria bacterium]
MLAFSALVAGSFSLGAMAAPHIAPAALTLVRFALAAALVGAAAALTSRPGFSRTPDRASSPRVGPSLGPTAGLSSGSTIRSIASPPSDLTGSALAAPWRYLVLGGLLSCYFVLMFIGLQTAAAVPTAAVFTLTPIMAAGFGWLLLGQITSARTAFALSLGGIGALWVIFRGDPAAVLALHLGRGEVIYFLGCIAHAIYAPMVRRLNRGETALTFTFGTLIAGFLWLLLWGGRAALHTDWAALPAIVWICLAYTVVAASALSFVLIQYATMRLPAAKVMAYTYLVPCWVILWELALGHPTPPLTVLTGVALILTALALLLKTET